ncbi:MAG: metal ABC transporter permease [Anaerolineae bacterium]|nr:metal ABC transporter permease [Anaerolineae bacterium]
MNISELLNLIFTDYTIRTVALGAAVIGLVSGVLSAYAVLRKQSLMGDVMSHAALPGVVIAFILIGVKAPLPLMIGAAVAGWLGTLLMMTITTQTRIKEDSAMGIVLAVFFGLGVALLSWVQRQGNANQSGLDKFIFGRAAALVQDEVVLMAVLGLVVLALVMLFWKEFKLLVFDREYAATIGYNVRLLDIVLTTLIVVAVVIGLETVGVVLMSAMIVAPGVAARQWTDRLGVMVVVSGVFGALAGVSGALISSLERGLPTGPVIVLAISVLTLGSLLFAPNRGVIWERIRARRNRRQLRATAVLETLYDMAVHHGDPLHPHALGTIRAALPESNVTYVLRKLANEGLVREVSGAWALTPAGVEQVQAMLRNARVEGTGTGEPGMATA